MPSQWTWIRNEYRVALIWQVAVLWPMSNLTVVCVIVEYLSTYSIDSIIIFCNGFFWLRFSLIWSLSLLNRNELPLSKWHSHLWLSLTFGHLAILIDLNHETMKKNDVCLDSCVLSDSLNTHVGKINLTRTAYFGLIEWL